MKKIFISYRRDDSKWQAHRIYEALRRVVPGEHLFMDIDSIPPGADFVDILEGWVGACDVMLALIGPGWIDAADPKTGQRRLDNPHDFVRIEIREALRRNIALVPVLLDHAPMPEADGLPEDLRRLVRRNAEFVEFRTFNADVARLVRKLGLASGVAVAEPPEQVPDGQRGAEQNTPSGEQRFRAEGRIPVLVGDRNHRETRWLLPGGGEWFCDIDGGPEMVVVPAGKFMMGSRENEPGRSGDEGPWHEVTFAHPFAVGRHAVTRGQFAAFVNATGRKTSGQWRNPGFPQDDSHPVVCVTWEDAKACVVWLEEITGQPYHLLTEAEWEYAARAGTTTPFWWGSSITPAQANYNGKYVYKGGGSTGEYRQRTVPVGSFQPNPWGLYNVHGNVWEWCEDTWYGKWISGILSQRVIRGGSWYRSPGYLRAAARNNFEAWNNEVGFRIARTLS
jgi:formylglycine-generating enzyme required for sulfatase activity